MNFPQKDIKELRKRLIKLLSDRIIDIALDFDLYAYVLNLFMDYHLMKFVDLADLKKGDVNFEHLNNVSKNLQKYYEKDDFQEKFEQLPLVKDNRVDLDFN